MSTENNQPVESVSKSRQRLTRSRVLLGIVGACLLLWSIKTIHHAMQPKYQGKTVQEWFENYEMTSSAPWENADPIPYQNLGTNAVWFLWHESRRPDSALTAWLMAKKDRIFKTNRGPARNHEEERQLKATYLIRNLGSAADSLIPEMIANLLAQDSGIAEEMAWHLSALRRKPELVVPALLQSLTMTNRTAKQRISHIKALGNYGPDALTALRSLLVQSNTSQGELFWLNQAILKINGPGPELDFFTSQLKPGDYRSAYSALYFLSDVGTNAAPAVPLLINWAQTFTNQFETQQISNVILKLDPGGLYQKP